MNGADHLDTAPVVPGRFNTTHWSVVLQAGATPSPQRSAALEHLCRIYWPPLFAFIRRKGYGDEDARDLTQQFFARLLERNDFETVHPAKGKFRTFLLAALTHFLSNERDRARAAKRGGGQTPLSLDELTPEQLHGFESAPALPPDKLYDLRWAMTVLDLALHKLRAELADAGKGGQFDRLKQYLTGDAAEGDYAAAAQQLGMTRQTVAVTVHRLRARYRELVRAEVAHTVSNPMDLEDEMRYLHHVLSQ